ncbi:MAG: (d)CMP kinase [Clostridiales bacterium]|nr:(d)CMP kinase [Clostridiales bacterium]
MKNIIIAIDGPAGAGKSTIAKIIAGKLGIEYIDTGAMYRAITLKLYQLRCDLNDEVSINQILEDTRIDFIKNSIFLDGKNVDEEIRTPMINENVSLVASLKIVRQKLVAIQQNIGKNKSIIMDGRDIGTYVFPHAHYKFFLTASVEERAYRRWKEMQEKGFQVNIKDIKEDIMKRDDMDTHREINPLYKASDAIEIDTTGKTMEVVVNEILSYIKK